MSEEGYIKYQCIWDDSSIEIPTPMLKSLNLLRRKLIDLSLLGAYENGIGYGNISSRNDVATFFITGSATGGKAILDPDDYALVKNWQFHKNQLSCTGKTKASSESLTHAAIYESSSEIRSVVHVHSREMWDQYVNKLPTSLAKVGFGTPEMAYEIKRLLANKDNLEKGIVIMGGHREGILTFGRSLDEAGHRLLKYYP